MQIIKRTNIPKEQAHGGSGARRVLATDEFTVGDKLEAITHGFLPGRATFDWHHHAGVDEIMIVLSGSGQVSDRDGTYEYAPGDVLVFPANVEHMIHNPTTEEHQMMFIRVRV